MTETSSMLLINHFKTIYRKIFLQINMLELIVSLFLMKNDGLGIFFSQNDIYITKVSTENA